MRNRTLFLALACIMLSSIFSLLFYYKYDPSLSESLEDDDYVSVTPAPVPGPNPEVERERSILRSSHNSTVIKYKDSSSNVAVHLLRMRHHNRPIEPETNWFISRAAANASLPLVHPNMKFTIDRISDIHLDRIKPFSRWSQVTNLCHHRNFTSKTALLVSNIAVPAGDLLLSIVSEHFHPNQPQKGKFISFSAMAAQIAACGKPFVLTSFFDENSGPLSTEILGRTKKVYDLRNHLAIHHSNYETVRYLLDSPKLIAYFVNAHTDPSIGYHPKLISIPLGLKKGAALFDAMRKLNSEKIEKKRLLYINNSGWKYRKDINDMVIAAFGGEVTNMYGKTTDMSRDVAESKFVLAPSGLSMDSYRIWEVILFGSIPIVESNPGLDRAYSSLPVMVVRNYTDLTPDMLELAYPCFVKHAPQYRYDMLTEQYWLDLIESTRRMRSIELLMENHPYTNKYCNFLKN